VEHCSFASEIDERHRCSASTRLRVQTTIVTSVMLCSSTCSTRPASLSQGYVLLGFIRADSAPCDCHPLQKCSNPHAITGPSYIDFAFLRAASPRRAHRPSSLSSRTQASCTHLPLPLRSASMTDYVRDESNPPSLKMIEPTSHRLHPQLPN
jgi:hypothetical protein